MYGIWDGRVVKKFMLTDEGIVMKTLNRVTCFCITISLRKYLNMKSCGYRVSIIEKTPSSMSLLLSTLSTVRHQCL